MSFSAPVKSSGRYPCRTAEDDLGFNPTAVTGFHRLVSRDQKVIRIPDPEYIYGDEGRRYHDRVAAVCRDAVDRLEPGKWLTALVAERHVPADIVI